MLKSTFDKIKMGFCAFKYGCSCCMDKKDKPLMRRELRWKSKQFFKDSVLKEKEKDNVI